MPKQPSMEVSCSVDNCKFHNNNYCFAPNLQINSKIGAIAKTSTDVQCDTFRLQ